MIKLTYKLHKILKEKMEIHDPSDIRKNILLLSYFLLNTSISRQKYMNQHKILALIVLASNEGSGQPENMYRLATAFAAGILIVHE